MYDTNLKIKEKVAFVKTLMDYEMREFLLKAYDLAFSDAFGEKWLEDFLEKDKQKKYKIAEYEKDECTWTEGLKHADFAASIKILVFDDKYRNVFCKYWGCDKNDNEKNVYLLVKQFHQFRNDCSHINSFTNYAILTPDNIMANMCALVNQCSGLCDDRGQLYSEIFQDKYKNYLIMSKTYMISELLKELNKPMADSEFIKVCRKNNIEVSADERSIVTEDIQRVLNIVGNDNSKNRGIGKKIGITTVILGMLIVGAITVFTLRKYADDTDKIGHVGGEETSKDDQAEWAYDCDVSIRKVKITDDGILIDISIYNASEEVMPAGAIINTYFIIENKDGSTEKLELPIQIPKQIDSKNIETETYEIPWRKELQMDLFKNIGIKKE